MRRLLLLFFLLALLLSACRPEPEIFIPPTQAASAPETPTPLPPPTETPVFAWISPSVPENLRAAVNLDGATMTEMREAASIRLDALPAEESVPAEAQSTWVYALVAAFPTVRDGVAWDEVRAAWAAGEGPALVMTESTRSALEGLFDGPPAEGAVRVVASPDVEYALWAQREAWGIVPFDEITPKLKVLDVDGQSPIRKNFEMETYPLLARFALEGADILLPASNRDPEKMTTVMMTGVTALVRATAYKMEQNGNIYPARDIRDWFLEADIAHISNEIPFAVGCPYPDPGQRRLIFCSDPKYIELLEYIGTDVVELTGNHFQDWGKEATLNTLEMYNERGWPYFGGGVDLADSRKPALLERGGMKFAFIGCNPVGPDFAWARDDGWPGAAECGDYEWIVAEIKRLKAEGYLVLATFQYFEYYSAEARPWQERDFRLLAEAGAVAVNGSQAHYPQVMEFYGDSFIHYGLGNLFFDQMGYDNPSSGIRTTKTRWGFITRYVFYDGRLASIELLTTMLEDFARPRPMTPEEREIFLQEYFKESGW